MNLIDPTPQNVREEIERVKAPEERMFYKCLLTSGGRSAEFAGVNCTAEKAYGTVGKGFAWLSEYRPKSLRDEERDERTKKILSDSSLSPGQVLVLMNMPPTPVKVAIFRIPIAKKKRLQGEPIIYRTVAIPYEKKYEPWAEEIYNYYQQRGNELLFPNNRKHYLDYIRMKGIFKHFTYPVERYTIREVIGKIEVADIPNKITGNPLIEYKKSDKTGLSAKYTHTPKHYHPFKLHGLRHVRTQELNNFYEIKDTLALCSFIGWSPNRGPEVMIARYGNIYENWGSYIGNLLKVRH